MNAGPARLTAALALAGIAGCASDRAPAVTAPEPAVAVPAATGEPRGPRVVAGTCFAIDAGPPPVVSPGAGRTDATPRPPRRPPRPDVRLLRITTRGGGASAAVQSRARHLVALLQACYQRALRRDASLRGRVAVRINVDRSGAVTRVRFAGSDVAHRIAACGTARTRILRFPSAAGRYEIHALLELAPGAGAGKRAPWPALPPTCGPPVDSPALAATSAFERCYRRALEATPKVGGRLTLYLPGAGDEPRLYGTVPDGLALCFAQVVADIERSSDDPPLACTLVLDRGDDDVEPGGDDGLVVDVDPAEARLGDARLVDLAELLDDRATAQVREQLRGVVSDEIRETPRWQRPRLWLRSHPVVEMRVIDRLLSELDAAAPSVAFARAIGTSDAWSVVNPLGSPADALCRPTTTTVAVYVEADAVTLAAGGLVRRLALAGDDDTGEVAAALAEIRASGYPGRTDAAVSAAPDVEYRAWLRLFELAVDAGFVDARWMRRTAVAARSLPPREP